MTNGTEPECGPTPDKPDPDVTVAPIGCIHSCFGEKFGIPRQPGLIKCATAELALLPPYDHPDALRGLDAFSHIWILFLFHASGRAEWKPTVRPPRLGGNRRIGVFASRSNFRPNPIGLSVVELLEIDGTVLRLGGGDFLDGTPVIDIKPYIPYADCVPEATGAFAHAAPAPVNKVEFTADADAAVRALENGRRPALRQLISDMLSYDPRPAYRLDDPGRIFGTRIFDLEVRWKQEGTTVRVEAISPASC